MRFEKLFLVKLAVFVIASIFTLSSAVVVADDNDFQNLKKGMGADQSSRVETDQYGDTYAVQTIRITNKDVLEKNKNARNEQQKKTGEKVAFQGVDDLYENGVIGSGYTVTFTQKVKIPKNSSDLFQTGTVTFTAEIHKTESDGSIAKTGPNNGARQPVTITGHESSAEPGYAPPKSSSPYVAKGETDGIAWDFTVRPEIGLGESILVGLMGLPGWAKDDLENVIKLVSVALKHKIIYTQNLGKEVKEDKKVGFIKTGSRQVLANIKNTSRESIYVFSLDGKQVLINSGQTARMYVLYDGSTAKVSYIGQSGKVMSINKKPMSRQAGQNNLVLSTGVTARSSVSGGIFGGRSALGLPSSVGGSVPSKKAGVSSLTGSSGGIPTGAHSVERSDGSAPAGGQGVAQPVGGAVSSLYPVSGGVDIRDHDTQDSRLIANANTERMKNHNVETSAAQWPEGHRTEESKTWGPDGYKQIGQWPANHFVDVSITWNKGGSIHKTDISKTWPPNHQAKTSATGKTFSGKTLPPPKPPTPPQKPPFDPFGNFWDNLRNFGTGFGGGGLH